MEKLSEGGVWQLLCKVTLGRGQRVLSCPSKRAAQR